ncbi:methionine adenosyltransferase [Acetobacterium paludosum]|uniref:S-adenosylmethionine synthase n=1 Tax=Acetobacterium paludosum TaxID=52693 RepID=A0A923KS29_9FIRM|nr:methionine adenosyltransferase [Acetobacterium paludosum]MBC3887917.1 methionine adenosyltransferase [Acetobacterium paludosum]
MSECLVTSESVTEGHPDKLCDQISDGILDAYLKEDPDARVAIETMASKDIIMIAGEVTSEVEVDVIETARKVIKSIGYCDEKMGLDDKKCLILTNINQQSGDIARGVDWQETEQPGLWVPSSRGCRWKRTGNNKVIKELGAGDQGIMYGYACDETPNFMPMSIDLASKLAMKLGQLRKTNQVDWLYPDGKTQVTIRYDEKGQPQEINSVVVSVQHRNGVDNEELYETILKEVIFSVIDIKWITSRTKFHINPTGRFVIGGPMADTGLTGRKIMVDTYGGVGKHGGGAFSGKDPTKVDRTAAYMARYVAKNIVAAGLAQRCELSLAYAIGLPEPEAVCVNTFGTERIDIECLERMIMKCFSFSVSDMIATLQLNRPQYLKTAAYGHFGREDQGFGWEKTDQVELLLGEI